jgi:hypothetical protein
MGRVVPESEQPPGQAVHVRVVIVERLRAEAEARGVSIAWMTNKLLAEGLERLLPATEFRLTRDPEQLAQLSGSDEPA